jgi:hypothetical protein
MSFLQQLCSVASFLPYKVAAVNKKCQLIPNKALASLTLQDHGAYSVWHGFTVEVFTPIGVEIISSEPTRD